MRHQVTVEVTLSLTFEVDADTQAIAVEHAEAFAHDEIEGTLQDVTEQYIDLSFTIDQCRVKYSPEEIEESVNLGSETGAPYSDDYRDWV